MPLGSRWVGSRLTTASAASATRSSGQDRADDQRSYGAEHDRSERGGIGRSGPASACRVTDTLALSLLVHGLQLGRCANAAELPAVASMARDLGRRRSRAASAQQVMPQAREPLLHACRRPAAALHPYTLPEADRCCGLQTASLSPVVSNMQRLRLR